MPARPEVTTRNREKKVLGGLRKLYPDVDCALKYEDPFQLLVATILSAQCTDKRVNEVTRVLFKKARTPKDFAAVPRDILEEWIRSTGFFRNKAKSIQAASAQILEDYDGKLPDTMETLVKLPGVGRKTANVVLGTAFGKNEGVVVDTHVGRLSQRLGLTKQKDPVKIEQDLMKIVPRKEWANFSHRMIWHGRLVCKAIKPKCSECKLAPLCPSADV